MTNYEIFVVIVLGLVGYIVTYALINFFNRQSELASKKSQAKDKSNDSRLNEKNKSSENWHEILGVTSTAPLEEIKAAYKKKISLYHPDKVSGMGPEFNEIALQKSKEINAAYDEAVRLRS